MAHNARANAFTWAPLMVPTAADFETLDANGAKAINGDDGGVWTPSSPITIGGPGGGVGLILAGPSHKVSGATAALITDDGGHIRSATVGGFQVGGGATDWPAFTDTAGAAAPRSRSVVISAGEAFLPELTSFLAKGTRVRSDGTGSSASFRIPVHNGARLVSVSAMFKPGGGFSGVPTDWPTIEVYRVHYNGTATSLGTATYPSEALGTWNSIVAKYLAVATSSVVDIDTYAYGFSIIDSAGGTGSTEVYWHTIRASFDSIADMRFQ